MWWPDCPSRASFRSQTGVRGPAAKKTSSNSLVVSAAALALLICLDGVVLACGPGRGGIRRRGPRKITPLVYRQHIPNFSERSLASSGLPLGAIDRTDERFGRDLVPNYNADIVFKDEEGTGADRLMTQRCKEMLNTLAISVMNQWPGVRLRVTESWDEDNHHSKDSLHYEGRAIDITTSDGDRRKYGLLARLAVESGFDWVFYESRSHVHVSCKSESEDLSNGGGGCFTGSSQVITEEGTRKPMSDLRPGDSVLTVAPDGRYEFNPVILFLDRDPDEQRRFLVIRTDSGQSLTLTPTHLVYARLLSEDDDDVDYDENESSGENTIAYDAVYASDLREGDLVLVVGGAASGLRPARIVDIGTKVLTGVYAPLTSRGNVVVDNVLASCYAVIDSQSVAHAAFYPVRAWNSVVQSFVASSSPSPDVVVSGTDDDAEEAAGRGVHWYANLLYRMAGWIVPSRLQSPRR